MAKLKILGKDWRLVHRVIPTDSLVHYGQTDKLAGIITINSKAHEHQRLDTMLHEVIHVVSEELGMNLSEQKTACLAASLCAFVLDNPKVFNRKTARTIRVERRKK